MNTQETFARIMGGEMTTEEIKEVLTAYHEKGVTADDLMAAASAMRAAGVHVACENPDAVDIVGTGGDFAGTFNVSTTAAFIAAGAGVTIAKHGNRAATSKCGTADVLEALGYDLNTPPEAVAEGIRANGIGFLFARNLHPAMRFVAPARRELKFKTIFNYLGPLTNPAGVKQHVIGVADPALLRTFAETLDRLGSRSALIVCGNDGMDEISTDGVTRFAMLRDGIVSEGEFDVSRLCGVSYPAQAIAGGAPEENAMILRGILGGGLRGAYRLAAVINAAAAIWMADRARSLKEGIAVAEESIDSGAARAKLEKFLGAGGRPAHRTPSARRREGVEDARLRGGIPRTRNPRDRRAEEGESVEGRDPSVLPRGGAGGGAVGGGGVRALRARRAPPLPRRRGQRAARARGERPADPVQGLRLHGLPDPPRARGRGGRGAAHRGGPGR